MKSATWRLARWVAVLLVRVVPPAMLRGLERVVMRERLRRELQRIGGMICKSRK